MVERLIIDCGMFNFNPDELNYIRNLAAQQRLPYAECGIAQTGASLELDLRSVNPYDRVDVLTKTANALNNSPLDQEITRLATPLHRVNPGLNINDAGSYGRR